MWYNPLITLVLRSPLHGLLSNNMLVISVTGRRSGKTYTLPVSYVQRGETLSIISKRERTWWRNLRSGAPVTLRLRGETMQAWAEALDGDRERLVQALTAYLQQSPFVAPHLGVTLSSDGQPDPAEVARAAEAWVLVQIALPTNPLHDT